MTCGVSPSSLPRIAGLFALGATEILVSPVPAGDDQAAALEHTLRLLSPVLCITLHRELPLARILLTLGQCKRGCLVTLFQVADAVLEA